MEFLINQIWFSFNIFFLEATKHRKKIIFFTKSFPSKQTEHALSSLNRALALVVLKLK